ncbi:MAG TPA: hypothetical protein VFE27_15710 [Acidobacteriaceae bacterium]|nr:hypothetical protein [Acidobacteriaceae bacterium]
MPRNTVSDPITDQEIAFARLILSGTMNDRRAAEAVGLNPETAAYTKSKPRVRAYMLEHRAAVQQQLLEQDTDLSRRAVDGQRRFNLGSDQVLGRLWELANLSPEMTRGSITGQVKALSMIIAIEGLIPDRRAAAAQNKPATPPVTPQIYTSAWLRKQCGDVDPEPTPPPVQEEAASEPQSPSGGGSGAPPVSGLTPEPTLDPGEPSFFGAPLNPSPTTSWAPRVPMADYVAPDTRVPFSIKRNPFARRR